MYIISGTFDFDSIVPSRILMESDWKIVVLMFTVIFIIKF